jgi:hypothetical protein
LDTTEIKNWEDGQGDGQGQTGLDHARKIAAAEDRHGDENGDHPQQHHAKEHQLVEGKA